MATWSGVMPGFLPAPACKDPTQCCVGKIAYTTTTCYSNWFTAQPKVPQASVMIRTVGQVLVLELALNTRFYLELKQPVM